MKISLLSVSLILNKYNIPQIKKKKSTVKIKNPQDEKYFKDITLNNILLEISKENETYHNKSVHNKTEKESQTQFYFKIMFFAILPILLLLFFFIPFKQIDTKRTKTSNIQLIQKKTIPKMQTKEKITKKTVLPKKARVIKVITQKKNPLKRTVREQAKEDLLKQMKN